LGFAKAHRKITPTKSGHCRRLWQRTKICGSSLVFIAMAEASDFNFGMPLRFAKVHHKITQRRKSGRSSGQDVYSILAMKQLASFASLREIEK